MLVPNRQKALWRVLSKNNDAADARRTYLPGDGNDSRICNTARSCFLQDEDVPAMQLLPLASLAAAAACPEAGAGSHTGDVPAAGGRRRLWAHRKLLWPLIAYVQSM